MTTAQRAASGGGNLPRRATRRPLWLALAAVLLLVAAVAIIANAGDGAKKVATPPVTAVPTHPPLHTSEGPPMPNEGVYLGAWVEPAVFSQPGRVASVQQFERAIGKRLDIVHLYRVWGKPFGTPSDLSFAKRGDYLLISWAIPDSRSIASGAYDAGIRRAALEIAALPTMVFLEPRWEMDRPNLRDLVHSPQDYIAAWDHIRHIFTAKQVTNVAWTWCPTGLGFDNGTAPAYYPGDDQVDWVCADIYPLTPWKQHSYEPFATLAQPFITWAAKHPKPIMIGEFAVGEPYRDRRAAWIAAAGSYIRAHDQIKAILWFEQSRPKDPPYHRWALQGDPAALQAFASLIRGNYFGRGG